MRPPIQAGLQAATRLIQAGRLQDATSLIQQTLGGPAAAAAAEPGNPSRGLAAVPGAKLRVPSLASLPWLPKPGGGRRAPNTAMAPLAEGARVLQGSHGGPAGTRDYMLYVPASHPGRGRPLVMMLHGCTQNPDDFAAGTRMNALAERDGFLVVYPAQSLAANPRHCWNWFNPADQAREGGEAAILASIARELADEFAVPPGQIFVAGLSAGGAMAAILGQAYPDLFAGVGVHSGLAAGSATDVVSALGAMRSGARGRAARGSRPIVPTIVFQGDRDTTVHPSNADWLTASVLGDARGGVSSTTEAGQVDGGHAYDRECHRDAAGRLLLERWTVRGAGHAWSGGSPAGSYTDALGPDASEAMVRFFLGPSAGGDRPAAPGPADAGA